MKSRHPDGAREHARTAIRQHLRAGRWSMGEWLDASSIAAELGLSPSPVRETLARLHGETILVARHRGGYSVPRLMPHELAHEYRLRGAIVAGLAEGVRAGHGVIASPGSQSVDRADALLAQVLHASGAALAARLVENSSLRIAIYAKAEELALNDVAAELDLLEELAFAGRTSALRRALRQFHTRRATAAGAICQAAEKISKSVGKALE